MLIKILAGLIAVAAVLATVIAMQPSTFRISRSAVIPGSPEVVFSQVNDFHKWQAWSPWANLDPASKASFSGPSEGKGAAFQWSGNNEVGEGSMTITESHPYDRITIELVFLRPFQATNLTEFTFQPDGGGTVVTWTMSGSNSFMAKAMGLVVDCDKMIGGQFEKGLENLKTVVAKNP